MTEPCNHRATIGVLGEPLPRPDNRMTAAEETGHHGQFVARSDYTRGDNDQATYGLLDQGDH